MDKQAVIARTRRWISLMVIGLNLCPFARRVFDGDKIRYAVTDAGDEAALLGDLAAELAALASAPAAVVETTFLIHPQVLVDFLAYNDFLSLAERLVADLGLGGVIQIASFHPDYQFAGTRPGAAENYTNRAPYPMLHLLREESLARVAADADEMAEIPRRNIATLRGLGREQILKRLKGIDSLENNGHETP
jgi:hypothetical protein